MTDNLETLRELILESRFGEAHQYLETINHPDKEKWLKELDEREAIYEQSFQLESSELPIPNKGKSAMKKPRRTLDDLDKPKEAPNIFKSILQVMCAGLFCLVVTPAIMVIFDVYGTHFSEYLMAEVPDKLIINTAIFAGMSAFLFGTLVRLIAGGKGIFAGIFYTVLMVLVFLLWHFFSYHLRLGVEPIFGPENLKAYSDYIDLIPDISILALLFTAMFSLSVVFTLGSLSDKALANKNYEDYAKAMLSRRFRLYDKHNRF